MFMRMIRLNWKKMYWYFMALMVIAGIAACVGELLHVDPRVLEPYAVEHVTWKPQAYVRYGAVYYDFDNNTWAKDTMHEFDNIQNFEEFWRHCSWVAGQKGITRGKAREIMEEASIGEMIYSDGTVYVMYNVDLVDRMVRSLGTYGS